MKLHLPKTLFTAVMAVMAVGVAQATITVDESTQTVTISGSVNKNISPDSTTTGSTVKTDDYTQAVSIPDGYKLVIDTEAANATNNWLANNAHTYDGLVQIGDGVDDATTGFVLTNGNGNTNMTFTGKVTGSGILHKSAGGNGMKLTFSGDVTEYTGNMNLDASAAWTLSFGNGGAAAATTATNGASGTGTITFNSGNNTLAYNYSHGEEPVYLTNTIVKGNNGTVKVDLKGGANYILTKNATINTLNFADSSTLQVAAGSTLNLAVNATQVLPEGNGFGSSTYTVGNSLSLAEGATLQLNGAAATLSEGVLTAMSTTYTVQVSETYTSTDAFADATLVDVKSGATMTMSNTTGTIGTKVLVEQGGAFATQGTGTLTVTTLQSSRGGIELGADTHITGGGNGQGRTNNKLGLSLQGVDGDLSIVAGTTTVDGAIYMGAGNTAANNTVNVGMGETDAKLVTERMELGDSNGGTSTLNIGEHGTVVVKSSTDISGAANDAYKKTGLLLSEWNNDTTANISGKLMAKDVQLRGGDHQVVLNVDGGILAVKGVAPRNSSSTLSLTNGGKLILGSAGIASNLAVTATDSEVGMTDNMTIAVNMELNGTVNFNTSKYTWDANKELVETNDGTNGGTMTVSGALSGTGSVVKNGAGTLNLTGANTYSGSTTVNGGKLSVKTLGSGDVTLNNASTLEITGEQAVSGMGTVTVNDASTIILGYGSTIGTSDAAATIVMHDGATLIQQNGNGAHYDSYADITIDGTATICGTYYGNRSNLHGTINGNAGSTLVLDKYESNVNGWTLSSSLSGGMALQMNNNAVTLSGDSSYTGGTTINGGTLTAGSDTALGTGAVELNGGSLVVNADVTVGGLTQNGGSITINNGKSLTVNTTENVAVSNLTLNAGSTITLGDHTPDLIISSATITGNTTIEADIVTASGATLTFNGGTVTLGCSVTFGEGSTIALGTAYLDELAANGKVLLFTDVESYSDNLESIVVTGDFASGHLFAEAYTAEGGVTKFNIYATPEPATATLSLLALAGLMARRKRH